MSIYPILNPLDLNIPLFLGKDFLYNESVCNNILQMTCMAVTDLQLNSIREQPFDRWWLNLGVEGK